MTGAVVEVACSVVVGPRSVVVVGGSVVVVALCAITIARIADVGGIGGTTFFGTKPIVMSMSGEKRTSAGFVVSVGCAVARRQGTR